MTPRGTDWALALLLAAGVGTGLATWFAGAPGSAWVFAAHAVAGTALTLLLVAKLRRVLAGLVRKPGDPRNAGGLLALLLVATVLVTGYVWVNAGALATAGFPLLVWHAAAGGVLAMAVAMHMRVRSKPPRARDLRDRRQFLTAAVIGIGALAIWQLERPVQRALSLPGRRRRFTGSYDAGSFTGNDFPATSWLADRPRATDPATFELQVEGEVETRLTLSVAGLDRGDELTATLDCTGGFFTTQRWRGTSLGDLLDEARPTTAARHVRVVSKTGYRWSFGLADARRLLLATHVGDEPLSHGHGAPCRLVAPGRRGFEWVKWVERIEVHEDPDPGAAPSTLWSGLTAAGRGAV